MVIPSKTAIALTSRKEIQTSCCRVDRLLVLHRSEKIALSFTDNFSRTETRKITKAQVELIVVNVPVLTYRFMTSALVTPQYRRKSDFVSTGNANRSRAAATFFRARLFPCNTASLPHLHSPARTRKNMNQLDNCLPGLLQFAGAASSPRPRAKRMSTKY